MKRYLVTAICLAVAGPFVTPSAAPAQGWGEVQGKVTFAGAVPKPEKIKVDQDEKHCLKDGPLFKETFIINPKNKGVKNVFVWLAAAPDGGPLPVHEKLKPVPKDVIVIDQPCCAFVPHAVAMREGQTLEARNSAPVPHNFKWSGHPLKNPGGNQIIPPGGKLEIKDLKTDRLPISVGCDIHKWMTGFVRVFDHPYFAVTDADGKFEIKNAPAGTWRLVAWQEGVGWVNAGGKDGEPITINAGKDTSVKLQVKTAP
jgi:hypothetical protein